MTNIVTKRTGSNTLYGLGAMAIGAGLIIAGLFFNIQLVIARIPVGTVGLIVLGAIAAIIGLVLLISKSECCVKCNKELKKGDAYLPIENEADATQIYQNSTAGNLSELPVLQSDSSAMVLSLGWCEHCNNVGSISLSKSSKGETKEIGPEKEISGPGISELATVVQRHLEARGDDDDE